MSSTYDHVTLAEVHTVVLRGAAVTDKDVELAALITAVGQRLDEAVGPVVYRDLDETYDGGGSMIQLRQWPVVTVTSVVEDGVTLPSTSYLCDYEKGQLWRRSGDWDYPWEIGRDNVEVVYRAGRYATTATVSERYKMGDYLMLQHLWRTRTWSTPGLGGNDFSVPQVAYPAYSVPNAVIEWFGSEWRDQKRGGFA